MVVDYTEDDPRVTLSLRQADILHALAHDDKLCDKGGCVPDLQAVDKSRYGECSRLFLSSLNISSILPIFHPEFGRFMLEATPGKPWGIGFKDLLDVEPNMKLR